MRALERRGLLDRHPEGLPDDAELERRRRVWRGLTRPEIAVLLAFAKLELFQALLRSSWVRAPGLLPELLADFPPTLAERFPRQVAEHRLRAEIVASQLTHWSIHRLGATALLGLRERSEAPAETAVAALPARRRFLEAVLTGGLAVSAEPADPYLLDLGLGLLQTRAEEAGV
jgi:glutamate dehydrogenase